MLILCIMKTRSQHSRLRWKSLLKPFASKRFTLASPPGDIFPLINFSLFFWRNAVSWKWFIIRSLISLNVSLVILLPHGGVAKTSRSLCVLAFSWAAAAGINATTAAPGSSCWLLQREEVLLWCEMDIPISEKTQQLAPPSPIRPEALSLLSGWSFAAGTRTDHIPARALIIFVMEE